MSSTVLFSQLGFAGSVMEGIEAVGYDHPTPIQQQAIPVIMDGRDLIASAQTGTGKTAAFLLPLIHKITLMPEHGHVRALIIVPTRELAIQIDQQLEGFSYFTHISSLPIYGGTDGIAFSREKQALLDGADIIVCTPGRLIAHLNMGYVKLPDLKFLVLDEADRMLDMGFQEDIVKIISHLPAQRQNLLFSATMPPRILGLAQQILHDPVRISLAVAKPADNIQQSACMMYDGQKIPFIVHLLHEGERRKTLIFCATKEKTHELYKSLRQKRLPVGEIHSNLEQAGRDAIMNQFRAGQLPILVATDIVSRGIDVDDIDLVVNFDVPREGEDYVHRVGRTARAAARGQAITLVTPADQHRLAAIEGLIGYVVPQTALPEILGEAPVYDPTQKPVHRKGGHFRKKKHPNPHHKGHPAHGNKAK